MVEKEWFLCYSSIKIILVRVPQNRKYPHWEYLSLNLILPPYTGNYPYLVITQIS